MNETCIKYALNMPDIGGCPYCEIDGLNKEINRLRQYEDAITSAIDGTLLVWNLISTNHTVIKNDYWQNHLEEIDRLKAELEEERSSWSLKAVEQFNRADDLERQLAEARAEVEEVCKQVLDYKSKLFTAQLETLKSRQNTARKCLEIIRESTCSKDVSKAVICIKSEFGLGMGDEKIPPN